ncbi:MAG: c-type cytochrome, partial [Flavobacteriales bacterium]|nr:c-type cytochrome [Flavobacteriales bacterium]
MRNTWVSLTTKMLFSTAILTVLLMSSPVSAQLDGEALFKANCSSCHKPDKKVVGPALQGARANWSERTEGDEAIVAWVQNSQDYIKTSGDSYAKQLFADYNGSVMTPIPLSAEEILAVLDYADNYAPPVAETAASTGVAEQVETESDPTMWLVLIVIIFFIVFRVLWGVSKNLDNMNRQKDGEEAKAEIDFLGALADYFKRNKGLTVVVIILLSGYIAILGWDWLNAVGVNQAYQPTQPIWFSHKVHAGQNGINCVYCHNSAEKGKAAGIPSVNICMNCHMGVPEGKQTGTKEIAKIYDAIGWDADKGRYIEGYETKPIEWVRIHNLQDFVYFNHSQHVVVGKQKCQTCHGPIEEMDEVYQYSDLTMGWCIDCHRETDVAMDDNGYYDRIHDDLVEKHKEEGLESFKVEHIGGLE